MLYLFPPYSIAYAIATFLALVSAAMVLERRSSPGYRQFALMMLALFIWSFASIFEAGALSVEGKFLWSKVQYFGAVSISPLWLVFTATYPVERKFAKSPLRHLVFVIPLITLVMAFTNASHHLLWHEIYIPDDSVNHIAIYDHGPWFIIHIGFSYLMLVVGTYWIISGLLRSSKKNRSQALVIFTTMLIAWGSNIIYVLGLSPIEGLDITTLSFTFISLVIGWLIYGRQLFNLVPVARNALVDNMTDGVIVLDEHDTVVDFNPAALALSGYKGDLPKGMTIWEMFKDYLPLILPLKDKNNVHTELELPTDPPRYLDVKIDTVPTGVKGANGQLITIRNITKTKTSEIKEKEQRQLAEALADTAAIINSSLDLDVVLEHILDNADKVVPHDTSNVAVVDDQNMVRFVKVKGYEKYSGKETILNLERPVSSIPNLKLMAETGKPYIVQDTWSDPEWVRDIPASTWIRSSMGAPIMRKGKLLGFIIVDAGKPNYFKARHMPRLQALADQAAIAIENARMFKEMEQLAITDSLTGIYNRRFFFAFGENEVERSIRYKKDLSMIMMDIDHFKKVNDRYGHPTGDEVLKAVADVCKSIMRKVDVICRFGGEEFTVLLPETGLAEAVHAAERICTGIAANKVKTDKGTVSVTVSVGVAELTDQANNLEKLLGAADAALYAAKESGRNRVVAK